MKHFGILGYPLSHTMSPQIHELLDRHQEQMSYIKLEIPPDKLESRLPELFALDGFNVTIPYKIKIVEKLDKLEQSAQNHGAVNVVTIEEDGTSTGYNTDCIGFVRAMEAEGVQLSGRVCVIGVGGAGRMFATECALRGCHVTLAVSEKRAGGIKSACAVADSIYAMIQNKFAGSICAKNLAVQSIENLSGEFDLMIQATPVGMYPNVEAMPVEAKILKGVKTLFDCIYNPRETKIMQAAREAGCHVCGGMKMLVWQAAAAQEIWFNHRFTTDQVQTVINQMEQIKMGSPVQKIVLCGFMGCGKSVVGEALAQHLQWDFWDTDSMIEKHENCSIPEIFNEKGEEYFRSAETDVAAELGSKKHAVISTGGGFVMRQENIAALMENTAQGETVIIYLDCEFEVCYNRICNSSRPIVKANTKQQLSDLFDSRVKKYRDIAVQVPNNVISDTVAHICKICKIF